MPPGPQALARGMDRAIDTQKKMVEVQEHSIEMDVERRSLRRLCRAASARRP